MNQSTVTVIIVSYNSAELTNASIASINEEKTRQKNLNINIVVVDNDSGDFDVVDAYVTEQGWADWVHVQKTPTNGGYCYGNNFGCRYALDNWDVDYFHLVNPDTQLRENAIGALVDFFNGNSLIGIAGSSFETQGGEAWPYAFRFPSACSEFEGVAKLGLVSKILQSKTVAMLMGDTVQSVDWMSGASMMMRRN